MKRRSFLSGGAAIGAGSALGLLGGCQRVARVPQSPVNYQPGQALPWINWAGNQSCVPRWREAPESVDQLLAVLRAARGQVRAVGAGHSFSAQVPTEDTLVSTDLLSGLVEHDPQSLQSTVLAGTRLHALGPLLDGVGQALPNMPDMDYPALGGAIANSVHATGTGFGSMSAYVTGLNLATPAGELIECSAERNAAVFQGARTSLGALGIVTEIRLQNFAPFQLTEVNRIEPLEEVLATLQQRCATHRHFEFFAIPYSSMCITVATDLARPDDRDQGQDDPQSVNALRRLFESVAWIPLLGDAVYARLLRGALEEQEPTRRTGPSYRVFPHVRVVRFREMEYTVPAAAGPDCLREILRTIRERRLPLCFPLEYRYVKADDIWLSMFEGRDGCSISVHQYGDLDYKAIFAEIEPIFWNYDGRPHWGKLHTLDAPRLAALYPRHWQDFQELRRSLDPAGKMLNTHLRTVLGV